MTALFTNVVTAKSGGCGTGIPPAHVSWNRRVQKTGTKRNDACANVSKAGTIALWRSCAGANNFFFEIGQAGSWRTIRSHPCGRIKLTRQMNGNETLGSDVWFVAARGGDRGRD